MMIIIMIMLMVMIMIMIMIMYCLKKDRSVLSGLKNSKLRPELLNVIIHDCQFF